MNIAPRTERCKKCGAPNSVYCKLDCCEKCRMRKTTIKMEEEFNYEQSDRYYIGNGGWKRKEHK